MSNLPLVTVLMPCFNAMPFLTEALDSIVNQSYTNLEILCINDGSTDATGEILDSYAQNDQRFKVVHNEQNMRLIKTLNKGIEIAKGTYIARMDADDISELNRIEVEMEYLISHPKVDLISTGVSVISEEGKLLGSEIPRQSYSESCFFASFFYVPFHHAPMIIKTSALKENLFLDEPHVLHTEDFEFFSRLLSLNYKCVNIPDKLYKVRLNSNSVSRQFTDIQDFNFLACSKLHYTHFTGRQLQDEIHEVFVNRINHDELTVSTLKQGLIEIKKFKTLFNSRINISEKTIRKEISTIYHTHLFDVFVQSFKCRSFKIRSYVIFQLLLNAKLFFLKGSIAYLRTKFIKP
jgi:glycosyltransferase involved in cell wall biosynthesis